MRAGDIRPGDELRHPDGSLSYTVLEVDRDTAGGIHAKVEFVDGGTGWRVWAFTTDTPLVRP